MLSSFEIEIEAVPMSYASIIFPCRSLAIDNTQVWRMQENWIRFTLVSWLKQLDLGRQNW